MIVSASNWLSGPEKPKNKAPGGLPACRRHASWLLAVLMAFSVCIDSVGAKSRHSDSESDASQSEDAGEGKHHKSKSSSSRAVRIAAKRAAEEKSDKADSKADSKSDTKSDSKSEKSGKDKPEKKGKGDRGKKGSADSKADEDKAGGLFGFGGGKKKGEKGTEPAGKPGEKTEKTEAVEDPNAPRWRNDPALISVMRDISKSLKDSEVVQKLENPTEKLIAKLAGESLDKALASSGLQSNRILPEKDRLRMEKSMTAEAWESGDVQVSPELRSSVVALWAKKVNGMLTVSIVGDYSGNVEGQEGKLGEFIAVIYAQSSVDKGFDIQSQQEVNYWIGKVADLKIDRGATAVSEKKSYYRLVPPVTARKREFLELALKYQEDKKQLAQKAADEKKKAEDAKAAEASNQKVAEALAKSVAEALAKAAKPATGTGTGTGTEASGTTEGGGAGEKKSEGAGAEQQPAAGAVAANPAQPGGALPNASSAAGTGNATPGSASAAPGQTPSSPVVAGIFPEPGRSSRGAWESPAPSVPSHPPSPGATMLYPARALAGQFLTVSVVTAGGASPESYVDLSFNGLNVPTNESGKVLYQVPEDATPGYSLHMMLSARPGEAPAAVNILQPLNVPTGPQVPKIDGLSPVVGGRGYMIIDGHNFDGIAERNRVIVDGASDASVLASSPVQIVAKIPASLGPGPHTATVSAAGLRSNPGQFDFVTVEINPVGPDSPKNDLRKLGVTVKGTQNKIRVRLTNQSKDIIKLVRGDEVVVVTSGGANNVATVPAQRIRSGNFRIETEILM